MSALYRQTVNIHQVSALSRVYIHQVSALSSQTVYIHQVSALSKQTTSIHQVSALSRQIYFHTPGETTYIHQVSINPVQMLSLEYSNCHLKHTKIQTFQYRIIQKIIPCNKCIAQHNTVLIAITVTMNMTFHIILLDARK